MSASERELTSDVEDRVTTRGRALELSRGKEQESHEEESCDQGSGPEREADSEFDDDCHDDGATYADAKDEPDPRSDYEDGIRSLYDEDNQNHPRADGPEDHGDASLAVDSAGQHDQPGARGPPGWVEVCHHCSSPYHRRTDCPHKPDGHSGCQQASAGDNDQTTGQMGAVRGPHQTSPRGHSSDQGNRSPAGEEPLTSSTYARSDQDSRVAAKPAHEGAVRSGLLEHLPDVRGAIKRTVLRLSGVTTRAAAGRSDRMAAAQQYQVPAGPSIIQRGDETSAQTVLKSPLPAVPTARRVVVQQATDPRATTSTGQRQAGSHGRSQLAAQQMRVESSGKVQVNQAPPCRHQSPPTHNQHSRPQGPATTRATGYRLVPNQSKEEYASQATSYKSWLSEFLVNNPGKVIDYEEHNRRVDDQHGIRMAKQLSHAAIGLCALPDYKRLPQHEHIYPINTLQTAAPAGAEVDSDEEEDTEDEFWDAGPEPIRYQSHQPLTSNRPKEPLTSATETTLRRVIREELGTTSEGPVASNSRSRESVQSVSGHQYRGMALADGTTPLPEFEKGLNAAIQQATRRQVGDTQLFHRVSSLAPAPVGIELDYDAGRSTPQSDKKLINHLLHRLDEHEDRQLNKSPIVQSHRRHLAGTGRHPGRSIEKTTRRYSHPPGTHNHGDSKDQLGLNELTNNDVNLLKKYTAGSQLSKLQALCAALPQPRADDDGLTIVNQHDAANYHAAGEPALSEELCEYITAKEQEIEQLSTENRRLQKRDRGCQVPRGASTENTRQFLRARAEQIRKDSRYVEEMTAEVLPATRKPRSPLREKSQLADQVANYGKHDEEAAHQHRSRRNAAIEKKQARQKRREQLLAIDPDESSTEEESAREGGPVEPIIQVRASIPATRVRLPTFDGTMFLPFEQQFEAACRCSGYDNRARVELLRCSLKGIARQILTNSGADVWTYNQLMGALRTRYGKTRSATEIRNLLREMYKKPGQAALDFADEVDQMASQAEFTPVELQTITYQAFRGGLRTTPRQQKYVEKHDTARTLRTAAEAAALWERTKGTMEDTYVAPTSNLGMDWAIIQARHAINAAGPAPGSTDPITAPQVIASAMSNEALRVQELADRTKAIEDNKALGSEQLRQQLASLTTTLDDLSADHARLRNSMGRGYNQNSRGRGYQGRRGGNPGRGPRGGYDNRQNDNYQPNDSRQQGQSFRFGEGRQQNNHLRGDNCPPPDVDSNQQQAPQGERED